MEKFDSHWTFSLISVDIPMQNVKSTNNLNMALACQTFSPLIIWKTSHKFWEQSSSLIINIVCQYWDSFLAQALVLLLIQYTATWSRGEGPELFLQSEPFQNFQNFSRNWIGLNNLYEILSQNLRKLGK